MLDDKTKYAILARLELEEEPKALASEYEVSYATVLRLRREYRQAKLDGKLSEVYNADKLIIEQAARSVEAPAEILAASELSNNLTGLDRLDQGLMETAHAINAQIKSQLLGVGSVSELEGLTKCLCDLREAFFAKGTQVAIQQNFGESTTKEKFGGFLAD